MRIKELFDVECDVCGRNLNDFGGSIYTSDDEAIMIAKEQGWEYDEDKDKNICPSCVYTDEIEVEPFEGLPRLCYATMPTTGETIIVKRGESGYYPSSGKGNADKLNEELGVTKAQAEAMFAGSMFGWDVPASNPANYDEKGKLIN